MKNMTTQKDNQLTAHHNNNMRMMGSSGGLRNALPDKKGNSSSNNNKHSGLLVSRLANRSEYLSSEDGLQRADGIGESYALLSNVSVLCGMIWCLSCIDLIMGIYCI